MATITKTVARNVIKRLLKGEDYRIEIVTLIDSEFLQFAIEFFKKIVDAKFQNQNITIDRYKKEFLDSNLPKEDIAINSGLNAKTISNMYKSGKKEIVIDAASEHYDTLYNNIKELVDSDDSVDLNLTVKFRDVSVDLNVNETLIVINTLAVKRAALRGGLWSTVGKRVEKPLMQTLCKLYKVSDDNYAIRVPADEEADFEREIDFYMIKGETEYKCEVKLMGKGNPESADAVIARDSSIFVADTLSDTNKAQLNSLGIERVELRNADGFKRFKDVLDNLEIPHGELIEPTDANLELIFNEIFS